MVGFDLVGLEWDGLPGVLLSPGAPCGSFGFIGVVSLLIWLACSS